MIYFRLCFSFSCSVYDLTLIKNSRTLNFYLFLQKFLLKAKTYKLVVGNCCTLFFFIRTSKFCLRLAVLNFFHFWGWNVLNLFLLPRLNFAMPQRRMSETHYFISFILFLSSSAHRQPLGGVLRKSRSATVLKPIKKYLQTSSVFH